MKNWLRSKTIWFNGLVILVAVLNFYGVAPSPEVTNDISNILLAVTPAVNFVLRFVTDRGIKFN